MTGKATKAAAPAAPPADERPRETIDQRLERLRKEKELLELELDVHRLRTRAKDLPDRVEL